MEKTKAQIAAEEYANQFWNKLEDGVVYDAAKENYKNGYQDGYNTATLKWSNEDMRECWIRAMNHPCDNFKEWLSTYYRSKLI